MTDKQLTEVIELLKPRVKVIIDYPNSVFKVGSVIYISENTLESFWNKYHHIFQRLEWWEERQYSELPKYIRTKNNDAVFEVESYTSSPNSGEIIRANCNDGMFFIEDCTPATKEEYESFINQNKQS